MTYYKLWRHDYRSPIQLTSLQVWDGTFPFALPTVNLDTSDNGCGAGWNSVTDLADGFRIAGLWLDGRPSIVTVIEPSADVITRGTKSRSSGGTLVRPATGDEIWDGIMRLSSSFGDHADTMAASQMAWREALARPKHDIQAVEQSLASALQARELPWQLRHFPSANRAWAAMEARATWTAWAARDAREARAAWTAWAAREAREARATWDAWAARAAWEAWAAREEWAARDAWTARAAWEAWAALTWQYVCLQGWLDGDPLRLTTGLRDAYAHGCSVALPTGPNELGYAMEKPS